MIGTVLRAYLLDDPRIAGLIGDRMCLDHLEQEDVFPAIVYCRIDEVIETELNGRIACRVPRYQLDCYATTGSGADALADTVVDRLEQLAIACPTEIDGVSIADVEISSLRSDRTPPAEGSHDWLHLSGLDVRLWNS